MPVAPLKYIKRCAEFRNKEQIGEVPFNTRGLYALLKRRVKNGKERFDVLYVGMAAGMNKRNSGIRGRLNDHKRSKSKGVEWSHFSIFEVHDSLREEEIRELEGILRHIYRKDTQANRLAGQKGFAKLKRRDVRINDLSKWKRS